MARNYSFFTIFSFEMICNFFDVSLSEKKKKIKKRKVFTLQIVWLKVAVQRCMLVIKRMTYWYELFMVKVQSSQLWQRSFHQMLLRWKILFSDFG